MPRPTSIVPKLRFHKSSTLGYVHLDGRDIWLGKFDDPKTKQKYHRLIAEWLANGKQLPHSPANGPVTVAIVVSKFFRHAAKYYAGETGSPAWVELWHYRKVLSILKTLYLEENAADFGPSKLKAAREYMIQPRTETDAARKVIEHRGWSRTYANHQTSRIKAIFRWAVENELVPPSVHETLLRVGGLRKGRTEARETDPVRPAPDDQIEAVRLLVPPAVQAMIDLQLLTGARPGELCVMRTCDIDTSGDVWVYRPAAHKTAHHGHRREIYIGPKARKIIEPLLKPDVQAFIFSPAESERARNAKRSEARESDETPSQAKRRQDAKRRRRARAPGDRYDVAAYRRAIARAAAKAYPPPAPLARLKGESQKAWRERLAKEQRQELRQWVRSHCWHPHQLRHNAATRLRKEFGIEAASVILGHATITVTQVYAEKNVAAARRIMGEVG